MGLLVLLGILSLGAVRLGAAEIGISFPDTTVSVGETILVPVYVDSTFTGHNVVSFENRFYFSDNYMDLISIETAGTLSGQLGEVQYDVDIISGNEHIHVAGAGAEALTGKGVLYYLKLHVKLPGNIYFYLSGGIASNYFNEGDPVVKLNRQGPVRIKALPTINISPDNRTQVVGDQVQYAVSSAVAPLTWWTGDGAIATIDVNGLLTAVGPGFTKVYVEDNRGIVDSTTTGIQVHPFHLLVRDSSFFNGQTVMFPVYLENDMAAFDIRSGQIELNYADEYLTIIGIHTAGTALEGIDLEWTANADYFSVGFANDVALSGQGMMFWVEASLYNPFTYNISTNVSFRSALFNEDLSGTFETGTMLIRKVPDLIVTPTTGEIYAGETVQFSSSNGFPPIDWWTSDTLLATIDNSGLLTALSGGKVLVHAKDSLGGTWTSGLVHINDLHLYLRDTVAAISQPFDLPVYQNAYRSGIEVYAFQTSMVIDTSLMHFVEVVTEGSKMEGWSVDSFMEGDTLHIAAAGSTPFGDSGTICYFRFTVDDSTKLTDLTQFSFADYIFNEGLPTTTFMGASLTFRPAVPTADVMFEAIDSVTVDSVFTIPILVGDLTGLGVVAYEFTFEFDTAVVAINGFSKSGTLSSGLSIIANTATPGEYTIAAAGTDTLTGSGDLLILEFTAKAPGTTALHWTNFMFNEGEPWALYSDGEIIVDLVTGVEDDPTPLLPRLYALGQNYPNPFNPTTTIPYYIAKPGDVRLEIFNSLGQRVRILNSGYHTTGEHSTIWDGKNDQGLTVPSGTYFYRLQAGSNQQVRKMLLIK